MNKEHCEACHTPHDTCKQPIHHPEGRPYAWVCDYCWSPTRGRCCDCATELTVAMKPLHKLSDPRSHPDTIVCDGCFRKREQWVLDRTNEDMVKHIMQEPPDLVNEPPHYKGLVVRVKRHQTNAIGQEVAGTVDVAIESIQLRNGFAKSMGFSVNLTDALKYLYRCDKKGKKVEDLEKCIKSIQLEIDNG